MSDRKRWHRMQGNDTRFLTGTDEHSVNIAQAAEARGITPREFVDEKVALFREAEDALLISPDHPDVPLQQLGMMNVASSRSRPEVAKAPGLTWLRRPILALLLLAWLLVACGPAAGSPSSPGAATPGAAVSAVPAARPTPTEAEILDALRFRRAFGLREDEAWIRTVAASPLSDGGANFGVPLLPFEVADLTSRPALGSEAIRVMKTYGAAVPEDWAGLFLDQQARGIVTGNFAGNLDRHRAALALLLPEGTFAVRQVRWSLADLRRHVAEVQAEADWITSAGTSWHTVSVEIDEMGNQVRLIYYGRVELATALADHFGNPGWLRVERYGPAPWTGPRGDLIVMVVDRRGAPVAGASCQIYAEDPEVQVGEIGYGGREDGRCLIENLPASGFRVEIQMQPPGQDPVVVAAGRATVGPGATALLRIVVPD